MARMDQYGNLIRTTTDTVQTILPTPIQTSSRSYHSSSSWWNGFNGVVTSIGNWLQEIGASVIALIITAIPTLVAAFIMLRWNFQSFGDGFGWGVLSLFADLFIVGIGYYAFMLVFGIIYAILYMVGYLFYNAYTLIIAIVLGLGIWVWVNIANGQFHSSNINISNNATITTPAYTLYRCTAPTLNVRAEPNNNSKIIGGFLKGAEIHVYDFEGDFARVEWDYSEAYVSKKYIEKM